MHACSEESLQTSAKNIFEKMGKSRVGRACALKYVGWYSLCMLQLVGSGAQSLRSLTVGSSTTSSFGGQGSSVESQIQECYSCTPVIIYTMCFGAGPPWWKEKSHSNALLLYRNTAS